MRTARQYAPPQALSSAAYTSRAATTRGSVLPGASSLSVPTLGRMPLHRPGPLHQQLRGIGSSFAGYVFGQSCGNLGLPPGVCVPKAVAEH